MKSTPSPLAVDLRTAAGMLSISERKLWELSKRGEIPSRRAGRKLLFAVSVLEAWSTGQAGDQGPPAAAA